MSRRKETPICATRFRHVRKKYRIREDGKIFLRGAWRNVSKYFEFKNYDKERSPEERRKR